MTRIDLLEKIADIAGKILVDAYPLQEQFNPETYEVSGGLIMNLSNVWHELAELDPVPNPEWTTTPPKEPGHYWAWLPSRGEHVDAVRLITFVYRGKLALGIAATDWVIGVNCKYTHWLGPLPVPAPPVVDDSHTSNK